MFVMSTLNRKVENWSAIYFVALNKRCLRDKNLGADCTHSSPIIPTISLF